MFFVVENKQALRRGVTSCGYSKGISAEDLLTSACSSIIQLSLTIIDTTAKKKVKNMPIKSVVAAVHHDIFAFLLYLRFLVNKIHPTIITDKV